MTDLFTPRPVQLAQANADQFTDKFLAYLPENLHVYNAFVHEALKVVRKGFQHYSARTIVHVLRHHSAVAEHGSEWKINDHVSPYLARLFALDYPMHADLFEFREAKAVTRAKGAA